MPGKELSPPTANVHSRRWPDSISTSTSSRPGGARLRLNTRADRGLELSRPRRSDEHRDSLAQPQLDALVPGRHVAPAPRAETHAPAAVLEKRVVATNLETDDLREPNAARRPEIAERDAHSLIGDVDVEMRQRDERRDQDDDDRRDGEQ